MSVDIPSGLQLPETNKQKKSGVKIRLEGNVCMERPLNESPLLKREREHFTPTLGILFLFSRLFPVPGPSPYWKATEKIDLTKAWERMTHSTVLEDSQFPSTDVVLLNSSGVDARRGLVTASYHSSWSSRNWSGVTASRVGSRNAPESTEV